MVKQVIEYTGVNFWFFTIAHAMSLDSTGNVDLAFLFIARGRSLRYVRLFGSILFYFMGRSCTS